jgi:hypothetical protein
VLRNTFGCQKEAITRDWNKFLAVELHSFCSSLNILAITSRRALAYTGGESSAFRILFGKSEEKKPLGRHRSLWENDIKIDPKEKVYESVD